jgi:DNA-directed RNA polymerase delta subunit
MPGSPPRRVRSLPSMGSVAPQPSPPTSDLVEQLSNPPDAVTAIEDLIGDANLWRMIHDETFRMEILLKERTKALEERRAQLADDEHKLAEDRARLYEVRRYASSIVRGRRSSPMRLADDSTRFSKKMSGRMLADAAHAILLAANRAMTRKEIAAEIEIIHGRVPSRDLVGHLGVVMWSDMGRFISLGRRGYGLVEWGGEDVEKALARRTASKAKDAAEPVDIAEAGDAADASSENVLSLELSDTRGEGPIPIRGSNRMSASSQPA